MSLNNLWYLLVISWLIGFSFNNAISGGYIENDPGIKKLWRFFRGVMFDVVGNSGAQTNRIGNRLQRQWGFREPFPCDVDIGRSKIRPKSVHTLKPGDIDVVAGLGDSLMCANGAAATNILHTLKENRGLSWAAGGQGTWREFTTFPNILKVFNPSLQGYATGDGYTLHKSSRLNLAEPGALSQDMLYSAQVLLKRMIADQNINVEQHWKVITIMIGGNNFCSHLCYDKNPDTFSERHRRDMIDTLRFIKKNIPRSFVNLVPIPPVYLLTNMDNQPPECWATHILECSCFFSSNFRHQLNKYIDIIKTWTKADLEVSLMEEFQDKDDFAVVFQPFTTNLTIPQTSNKLTDLSYLSTDCFHLSQKSNALAGASLFRNMLQPVGQKDTKWRDYYTDFPCPTRVDPYFKTNLNSKPINIS